MTRQKSVYVYGTSEDSMDKTPAIVHTHDVIQECAQPLYRPRITSSAVAITSKYTPINKSAAESSKKQSLTTA